jgi:hypothetical protein
MTVLVGKARNSIEYTFLEPGERTAKRGGSVVCRNPKQALQVRRKREDYLNRGEGAQAYSTRHLSLADGALSKHR